MFDSNRITQDISRAQTEYARSKRELMDSESKARIDSRDIQDKQDEIKRIERNLDEKKDDLERALRDYKRLNETIEVDRKKEGEYRKKITELEARLTRERRNLEKSETRKGY